MQKRLDTEEFILYHSTYTTFENIENQFKVMEIKWVTVENGECKCVGGLTAKQKGGNLGEN